MKQIIKSIIITTLSCVVFACSDSQTPKEQNITKELLRLGDSLWVSSDYNPALLRLREAELSGGVFEYYGEIDQVHEDFFTYKYKSKGSKDLSILVSSEDLNALSKINPGDSLGVSCRFAAITDTKGYSIHCDLLDVWQQAK